jgi:hypothetical protein
METASHQEELGIALPALIVSKLLETGKGPDILDVRAVSPELADSMQELGYDELTADLMRAFLRTGDVKKLDPEKVASFRGPAVRALAGG